MASRTSGLPLLPKPGYMLSVAGNGMFVGSMWISIMLTMVLGTSPA